MPEEDEDFNERAVLQRAVANHEFQDGAGQDHDDGQTDDEEDHAEAGQLHDRAFALVRDPEVIEIWHGNDRVDDLRVAGFLVAIDRVAASYRAKGL